MPWWEVRRRLAKEWGVPPWIVDEAPFYEVDLALDLINIEAASRAEEDG